MQAMNNAYLIYFAILSVFVIFMILVNMYKIFSSEDEENEVFRIILSGSPYSVIVLRRFFSAASVIVGVVGFFVPFFVFPYLLCIGENTTAWSYLGIYIAFTFVMQGALSKVFLMLNIGTKSALVVVVAGGAVLCSLVYIVCSCATQAAQPVLVLAAWEITRELYSAILETKDDFVWNMPLGYAQNPGLQARTKFLSSIFVIASFVLCICYVINEVLT